jgi:hypothetical protein
VTTLRAHFDGKVLVPEQPVDLPVGKSLHLDVREAEELRPGSPAAAKALMLQPPHVSSEDVDALEQAIKAGRMPVRYDGIFDEPRKQP